MFEGNYTAETFLVKTFFSCGSNELHLLTLIHRLFCVCVGLDVWFFFVNMMEQSLWETELGSKLV